MDPIEKSNAKKTTTLGDLISFYYDRFSEIYEAEELRNLAVSTMVEDVLARPLEQK